MDKKDLFGVLLFIVALLLFVYNIAIIGTSSESKKIEFLASSLMLLSSLYAIWLSLQRKKELEEKNKK